MAYTTPSTWSGTTVVTAAQLNAQLRDNMDFVATNMRYFGGVLIAAGTVAGTTTYSFTSIPATYKHLMLRAYDLYGTTNSYLQIQFNGDSGANYTYMAGGANSGGVSADYGANNATGVRLINGDALRGTVTQPSALEIKIFDYAGTIVKQLVGTGMSGSSYMMAIGGSWNSTAGTATIGTVTVSSGAGNWNGKLLLFGFDG
jgi:hypothetical protein